MPRVHFTRNLLRFFPGLTEQSAVGTSVAQVLAELERRHPGLASYLTDEQGRLREHVNVFVGNRPIQDRERLGDPLADDDEVYFFQALSGG